jgi:hypothetical protein
MTTTKLKEKHVSASRHLHSKGENLGSILSVGQNAAQCMGGFGFIDVLGNFILEFLHFFFIRFSSSTT